MTDRFLSEKVALVTGSSRGIGRAIALELARLGADIVVNYVRKQQAAAEVVAAVEALGSREKIAAVCLGIAGVDRPRDEEVIRGVLRRLGYRETARVVNDAAIALDADEFDPDAVTDADLEEDDELAYRAATEERQDDLDGLGPEDGFDEARIPEGLLVPGEELAGLDPLYKWVVHGVREALLPVGHEGRSSRAGLILGNLSFPSRSLAQYAEGVWLDQQGPSFLRGAARELAKLQRRDAKNRFMSGSPATLSARALGLEAGALALDAACASALYALKMACDFLHDGCSLSKDEIRNPNVEIRRKSSNLKSQMSRWPSCPQTLHQLSVFRFRGSVFGFLSIFGFLHSR